MNTRTTILSVTAVALLGLTACGSSVQPSANATEVAPAADTTKPAETTAPAEETTAPAEDTDQPMDEDTAVPADDSDLSERGLHVFKPGDAFEQYDDSGSLTGTMTVNKLNATQKCTADPSIVDKPENGRFIGLSVSIVTPKADGTTDGFTLDPDAFSAIAANGTSMNNTASTFAAFTCIGEKEQAPTELRPGRKASGLIVLDVPKGATTLVYEDVFSGEGWEMAVPAK